MLSIQNPTPISLNRCPDPVVFMTGHYQPDSPRRFILNSLWAIHLYEYHGTLRIGDFTFCIEPGSFSITPPGVMTEYVFPKNAFHYCAHFYLRKHSGKAKYSIPLFIPPGAGRPPIDDEFIAAIKLSSQDKLRGKVKLWNILLDIAHGVTGQNGQKNTMHPILTTVISKIETVGNQSLSLGQLAEEARVSRIHLNRIFKSATGETVMARVRRRRLERARHLLLHTTLPIKQIAFECGIPDLHAFNKLIKKTYGHAPRNLRRKA